MTRDRQLLIITNHDDLTADYLITRLRAHGLPYSRLNSETIRLAQVSASISDEACRRTYSAERQTIDLEEVTAVWYRRLISPTAPPNLQEDSKAFIAGELRHLVEGLVMDSQTTWVNPIAATSRAERKLYQLRVAKRMGIDIPNTLVSNEPTEIREFVARHEQVVTKPIFHGLFQDGDRRYAVYTRLVDLMDLADDEQLRLVPSLFQEYVRKGRDIRVTVVGNRLFAARTQFREDPPVDWRVRGQHVQFQPYSLSSELAETCRKMLRALGLLYGAFDFVESASGELYFLEVNPTGEWAWLEQELGTPISEAFVELFYG